MATEGKPTEETGHDAPRAASDFLPEVQEADATPEIRTIYDEIRHLTGVPMVALIWRHLATLPGVLPDVWSSLAPVLRSGLLPETAWQIAADGRIPALPALSAPDLRSMNVDAGARTSIDAVLAAYNRANPVNMLCVYTLLARLIRPDGQALAPDVVLWDPPQSVGRLPRMYAPAEMPPLQRQQLEAMASAEARGQEATHGRAIPSLYRHLVPWPMFVEWLTSAIRPSIDDGRLRHSVSAIRASMAREAESLVVHVPPALALQAHPSAKTALTRFSSLIPEMIVVGRMLEGALPDPA